MIHIKYSIGYIFRGDLLRMRVYWDHGKEWTSSLGYHVDRKKWNGSRCANNTTHGREKVTAAVINRAIDDMERRVADAFATFETRGEIPTKDQLKMAVTRKGDTLPGADIYSAIDEFINEGNSQAYWSHATGVKFRSKRHLIEEFNKTATNRLQLGNINERSLNEFVNWMTTHCISRKEHETNYRNTTILKNVGFLKWFLRWARKKGYLSATDRFEDFRPNLKVIKQPVIFLTWDELMRLYHYDFGSNRTHAKVRDLFCLSCFTSLRYSDVKNLRKGNVRDGAITITTVKTSDTLTIELNKFAAAILDRYSDIEGEHALPAISSQKMNVYLKEIGRICGIDTPVSYSYLVGSERHDVTQPKYEMLSTHAGRRTFICNALALGIAPNTVMKWTGHSSYSSMQPYIDIADDIKKKSMGAFDRLPD